MQGLEYQDQVRGGKERSNEVQDAHARGKVADDGGLVRARRDDVLGEGQMGVPPLSKVV